MSSDIGTLFFCIALHERGGTFCQQHAEIKSIQSSFLGRKSLSLPFCSKVMATLMVKVNKIGIHRRLSHIKTAWIFIL